MIAPDFAQALEEAGVSGEVASARASRLRRVLAALGTERRDIDTWAAWFVPGRIEVLGKHTDYGGGRSLICAAERGFDVVSAPRADGRVALTDLGRGRRLTLEPRARRTTAGGQLGHVSVDRVAPSLPKLPRDAPRHRPRIRERPAVGGGHEQLERSDDCRAARAGPREPARHDRGLDREPSERTGGPGGVHGDD